jgi:hypothetical protein
VINNINDEALIYRNTSRDNNKENEHYLGISFQGDNKNKNGLGTFAEIHYDHGKEQVYENSPYRGYLSTIENKAHFGLGKVASIDTVLIRWPNGKMQVLTNIKADQVLTVKESDAAIPYSNEKDKIDKSSLFSEITDSLGIHYNHDQKDYIDFG